MRVCPIRSRRPRPWRRGSLTIAGRCTNCCRFMCRRLVGHHPSNADVPRMRSNALLSGGAETTVSCGATGALTAIKNPWNFSTLRPVIQCGPPVLGNATGAVLAALGYTAAQRQQLFDARGVAGSHEITQTVTLVPPRALPSPPAAAALVQRRGGPLAGVQVLDISGLGVGPVTGLFLAELGADVVKVEPPHGDLAHTVLPRQHGTSVLYISANLCKRGIVLNLKDPRDLERAYRLAERADVFVENFRVGVVERLGLGYQVLAEQNPRLIYCSISGFGPHGP